MDTADIITLASMAGLALVALVGLAAIGGLRQALRMVERQTRRGDAAREHWQEQRGLAGLWRARALDAEHAVHDLEGLRYRGQPPAKAGDATLTYRDGFHDGARHRTDRVAAGLPVTPPAGNGDAQATRAMHVVEGVDGFDGSDR